MQEVAWLRFWKVKQAVVPPLFRVRSAGRIITILASLGGATEGVNIILKLLCAPTAGFTASRVAEVIGLGVGVTVALVELAMAWPLESESRTVKVEVVVTVLGLSAFRTKKWKLELPAELVKPGRVSTCPLCEAATTWLSEAAFVTFEYMSSPFSINPISPGNVRVSWAPAG